MRIVKQLLIGFVVFGTLLWLISLLLPSRISVSKTVLVNAAHDKVTGMLLQIEDWKNWNPIMQDTMARYSMVSPQQIDWISADGVANTITLKQTAPDSISVLIRSNSKPVFSSGFTVVSHPQDSLLTKIEWWMDEELRWYPWAKFYGLFSESFREAYLDNTLQGFKRYVESSK